ncbi:MAG: transcription elongation factor, partial [Methyloceanibacter sp.]
MSKAFTKEPETGDVYDDLPDRPVSPHNLVTPQGLEMIEAELARLHLEHTAAQEANDRALLTKTNRDLRYGTSRRATAQVMEPPKDAKEVHFGSTVTI